MAQFHTICIKWRIEASDANKGRIVAPLQLLPLFFIWSEIRDKKNDLIREVQFYKILSSFLGFNDVYLGKTINISNSFYTVYGIVK